MRLVIIFLIMPLCLFAQDYQGPAPGSIDSGITKSTANFGVDANENEIQTSLMRNKPNVLVNNGISNINIGEDNYRVDTPPFIKRVQTGDFINPELDFDGPNTFNCWVPDCNVIPGPVDMLLAINTKFSITDKQGNVIKEIGTNSWFSEFIGAGLVFDPKCYYDKSSKRFIMSYLYYESSSSTSLLLLCVSDDSTAEGNWNIWSMPANVNGTMPDPAFADFPTLTVTENAIYWLNDMYPYGSGNPEFPKLRVIKKSDVLAAVPGVVNWNDIWDFRNPLNAAIKTRTLKLVHNLDSSGSVYIVGLPNPSGGTFNYILLYKIKDDYANPIVTSSAVSCSNYSMPPHMIHLGGGKPMQLWWFFYSEQVQRNGKIYAAHSSRNSSGLADIHYMEIDTISHSLSSEIFLTKPGYYYGYPDIMVDQSDNVFMVYNRTSASEYPGVYYTAKRNGASGFLEDMVLKAGEGDFNVPCGNTSNPFIRFEDYTDIMFDPVDTTKIWIMGEYIGADNKWKSRVGMISIENTIGISSTSSSIPKEYKLEQNYPNPFNPSTKINFQVPGTSFVRLTVYDIIGREITVLVNNELQPGSYQYNWNAVDLPGGVYFYSLKTETFSETKKMILVK